MSRLSRRQFLWTILTFPHIASAANSSMHTISGDGYRDEVLLMIEKIIGPIDSIVRIGKAAGDCNQQIGLSRWSETFLYQLCNSCAAASSEKLTHRMKTVYRKKLSLDFALNRTTTIDGWVLSRTETELSIAITGMLV